MLNGRHKDFLGFLIHIFPDVRKNRLYLLGRLSDGRSFAFVEEDWRPYFHLSEDDYPKAARLLKTFQYREIPALKSFYFRPRSAAENGGAAGGEKLVCFEFAAYNDRSLAAAILKNERIQSPDADIKPAELFLTEKQIKSCLRVKGAERAGKRVDVVFRKAEVSLHEGSARSVPLRIASIDIETDVAAGMIRAAGISWADTQDNDISGLNEADGIIRVLSPEGCQPPDDRARVISGGPLVFHADEKSLLTAFLEDIRKIDPDILTGWNFLDFDFPRLAERYAKHNLPFTLGRSKDSAKFFPADEGAGFHRRRSAAAVVPGRQALDALRVMRAGTAGASSSITRDAGQGFSLDETARRVLGEGKIVSVTGDEKIAALDRLYSGDPARFAEYCLNDARLVLRILAKTGLYRLTIERACLTGVSIDKAWTSVVSFERIYALQLRKHGIAPPAPDTSGVTGAAGGTVLESEAGLFENVAVFDFRSLYPTIIQTFNIDPLSHAGAADGEDNIVAPNGAAFSREPGLLPSLIAGYFATRTAAIEKGDAIAAQVYKILMNSFYGVLGTSACRYGKSRLAGAITSFARKWLLFSRDWFNSRGFHVLYGDTDSLFIKTGFGDIPQIIFKEKCRGFAEEINSLLSRTIKKEYDLTSFIELRFEKAYRRFLIPPVRNIHPNDGSRHAEGRGRAKGYGGYVLNPDGSCSLEVTGMEAIRSDTTPLARRLQLELLDLVFQGRGEEDYRGKVTQTVSELRGGKLDHELVYRKRLTRYPETYTSLTPPQVKAARALGWKKRRGAVEYLWTVNGPEPASLLSTGPDYDHYVESQIFPLARSIAAAVQWDTSYFVTRKGGGNPDAQMELKF